MSVNWIEYNLLTKLNDYTSTTFGPDINACDSCVQMTCTCITLIKCMHLPVSWCERWDAMFAHTGTCTTDR